MRSPCTASMRPERVGTGESGQDSTYRSVRAPRYGAPMSPVETPVSLVETVRGPVDVGSLGVTLMHEHVFVLNEEVRRNYPGDWDEAARIDDAVAKLTALAARGGQTIADPTVLGLGRDIGRVQQVAAQVPVNIIAATGLYTYNEVPLYFKFRGPGAD